MVKSVASSESVKLMPAVSPIVSDASLVVIAIVGGVVSGATASPSVTTPSMTSVVVSGVFDPSTIPLIETVSLVRSKSNIASAVPAGILKTRLPILIGLSSATAEASATGIPLALAPPATLITPDSPFSVAEAASVVSSGS